MYVALTRARDHLAVTVPQRFYHHRYSTNGAHSYALPSRFLDPVGDLMLTSAVGAPSVPSSDSWQGVGVDVAAELRSLWE